MGTINPETLYNKVYSDTPFKSKSFIIDDIRTKDFQDFLQRTKPNFNGAEDPIDVELMESLSDLVHSTTNKGGEICKDICNDIQETFCDSICNKIHSPQLLNSRMVIGGLFVSLIVGLVYKIRVKNRVQNREVNTEINGVIDMQSKILLNENSSEEEEVIVEEPRIVYINKSWWVW